MTNTMIMRNKERLLKSEQKGVLKGCALWLLRGNLNDGKNDIKSQLRYGLSIGVSMSPAGRELYEILNNPYNAYGRIVTADDSLAMKINETYKYRLDEVITRFKLIGDVDQVTVFEFISTAVFLFAHFIARDHVNFMLENHPIDLITIGESFKLVKCEEVGTSNEVRQNIYTAIYFRLAAKYDEWDPIIGIGMTYQRLINAGMVNLKLATELMHLARQAQQIYYQYNPAYIDNTIH